MSNVGKKFPHQRPVPIARALANAAAYEAAKSKFSFNARPTMATNTGSLKPGPPMIQRGAVAEASLGCHLSHIVEWA